MLGRKACLGMKIVSYLDNDMINKPNTDGSEVYTGSSSGPLTKDKLISKYLMSMVKGWAVLKESTTSV